MKKLFAAALMIAAGSSAMAQNNVGCGWGSAVFNGQRGVAPQVLAATTNGTSGNQTFGITRLWARKVAMRARKAPWR